MEENEIIKEIQDIVKTEVAQSPEIAQVKSELERIKDFDDGEDYVLTEADKAEIATLIKVPIVEKIIEKTQTIIEQPIVTNKIKEVAVLDVESLPQYGEKYRDGLELIQKEEDKLKIEAIGFLSEKLTALESKTLETKPRGGTPQGLRSFIDGVNKGLISSMDFKAGTGMTITHSEVNGLDTVTFTATVDGGSSAWGDITGTLSNQTDLQSALDGKANALGSDDNYVTDAEKVKLSNLSGTNTGDQTTIVGITGTKAQFDTAVTDGNIMYVGDAPTTHAHAISDVTGLQTALDNKLDDTQFVGLLKITVGTSAPGSPTTGDLWVDTN